MKIGVRIMKSYIKVHIKKVIIAVLLIFLIFTLYGLKQRASMNINSMGNKKSDIEIFYKEEIKNYSKKYNLDPNMVAAVIKAESGFNKEAVSHVGAIGLMQIMPDTGEWVAKKIGMTNFNANMLYDINTNIEIGCWYLNYLKEQFKEEELVLAAYNGGPGNVTKWLGDERYSRDGATLHYIPFNETKEYVGKVQENYKLYKTLSLLK